jgi:DNA-directed RNA polymerase specialized sigma24 family protein
MTHHLAGLDHHQIADRLGLPVELVYGRFHRAKATLRRFLGGDEMS